MSGLVFDLTEVFRASTGRFRMYGILRVVEEIAQVLARRNDPVQFAVFSYTHQGFIEIRPQTDQNGQVDLAVPLGISEYRIRSTHDQYGSMTRKLLKALRPLMQQRNQTNWRRAEFTPDMIDMTDKTLVSASRPKIISDAIQTLRRKGVMLAVVPLLHDLIPLHKKFGHKTAYFPGKFMDDNRTILACSNLVLANSEFTKSEILHFTQQGLLPNGPDIRTVQLAHECSDYTGENVKTLPEQGYLLTVGLTMGRKNLEVVFEALLQMQSQGKPVPRLVMAGNLRRTTQKTLKSPRLASLRPFIEICNEPTQAELVALYRGACALVLPSRMEGWGLPAGEALWCGTPVICADVPALTEVCGDFALYFDPDDPGTLATHITGLTQNKAYSQGLRARIAAEKPRLRSWEDVTDDLLAHLIPTEKPAQLQQRRTSK